MDPISHCFQSVNKTDLESKQILFQSAFTHPSAETLDPGRAWLSVMSKRGGGGGGGEGLREMANRGISNTTHVPRAPGSAIYSTEHKTKREREDENDQTNIPCLFLVTSKALSGNCQLFYFVLSELLLPYRSAHLHC